ncbi:MAG: tetratricopeptide repeat protein [Candidatus Cloacimonetes bacterium]|nr:tetratricopeptide repeat protein [Candidatus Cloacimonadota bacterium]MBS3768012.1 tetratricopeptide repeat protein [Candidatus Cloacimonadota bacterium]
MKKYFFVLLLLTLLISVSAFADIKNQLIIPDSLLASDSTQIITDTLSFFLQANLFYEAQDYKKSAIYYSKFIETDNKHPLVPVALYLLGNSYNYLDQKEKAIEVYKYIYEKFYWNYYAIISLKNCGDLYFEKKDYQTANRCYWNFVYYTEPGRLQDNALFQIERCNYYLGIYEKPTEIYKNFIQKFPHSAKSPELNYKLANYYMEVENFEEARMQWEKILENYKYYFSADSIYFKLAKTDYELNNFESCIDTTFYLLQKFPNSKLRAAAFLLMEEALVEQENRLQAIKKLNVFIENIPQSKRNNYYKILANLYQEIGFYQQVISIYNLMIHNAKSEQKKDELASELKKIIRKTGHKNAIIDSLETNKKSETLDLYDIYYE